MKIIKHSTKILLDKEEAIKILKKIELMGRICYQSSNKISESSYKNFITNLIKRNHTSVLEHGSISVIIECSRSVSHEIVRHRVGCSYSQESQRYVNYKNISYIDSTIKDDLSNFKLKSAFLFCEQIYQDLIKMGCKPEEARECLPNAAKTQLGMTYTLPAWRHFFIERGKSNVYLPTRLIAIDILKQFKDIMPVVFDDFNIDNVKNTIQKS